MIPGMLSTDPALHTRALEALRQRQMAQHAQASEHGNVLSSWDVERPDPNLGMYNDIIQGLAETGSDRTRMPRQAANPVMAAWQTNPANPFGPTAAQAAMNALVKQKYPGAGV